MDGMINDPRVASIPYQDDWIDEASDELKSYNTEPFINTFMKDNGLKPENSLTRKKKLRKIKRCIRSKKHRLKLDHLAAYLDELKPYGRQMIFLWRLKDGHDEYLSELHDRNKFVNLINSAQTQNQNPEEPLDWNRLIWESTDAQLAGVYHSWQNGEGLLRFKWVISRGYFFGIKVAPGQPPAFAKKTQRAVTFFTVNLENGDCELRIQSLPNGKLVKNPRYEFEAYRDKVDQYVKLYHFEPVPIEPVARYLLRKPILPVTVWDTSHPSWGRVKGTEIRGRILPKLLFATGRFFARGISVEWSCDQKTVNRNVHFSLDGCRDCIEFGGVNDASKIDFILGKLRNFAFLSVDMPELRQLMQEYPEHSRIISSMDHLFMGLKKLRIRADELSDEVWYRRETTLAVFRLAVQKFPSLFTLQGDNRDELVMDNSLRIGRDGYLGKLIRQAEDKGRPALKKVIKPAITVFYGLLNTLFYILLSWVRSKIFEEMTGFPFVAIQVMFLGFTGLLIYGKGSLEAIFTRLPKWSFDLFRWTAWLILSKRLKDPLLKAIKAEYDEHMKMPANRPQPGKYELESSNGDTQTPSSDES